MKKNHKTRRIEAAAFRSQKAAAAARTFEHHGPERPSLLLLAAYHLEEVHPDCPDAVACHPQNVLDICEKLGWPSRILTRMRRVDANIEMHENACRAATPSRD